MSYIPFDKLIDKATERELVYDIVERLSLGKPMYNELNSLYYEANTMVTDVFKKIIKMLPPDVEADYSKIQVANMEIPAGSKSGICRFNDLTITFLQNYPMQSFLRYDYGHKMLGNRVHFLHMLFFLL